MSKIKLLCKSISRYSLSLQYECILLQFISLITTLIFKVDLFIIDSILLILASLVYFLLKDFKLDKESIKLMYTIYKLQFILGFTLIFSDILWSLGNTFGLFNFLGTAFLIIFPILLFYFFSCEKYALVVDSVFQKNIWTGEAFNACEKGDVRLGEDIETKQPLYQKYKDRFVHTLILGPTGCGKTSQTIIPMIHSDLKNHDLGLIALEPKGDLAEKIFALANFEGRKVQYFNPILKDCPYFNPLMGNENDVIENLVTTLKSFDTDSKGYFQDSNEILVRRAVKVLKRLYGDDATLNQLDVLMNNVDGLGMKMISEFSKLQPGVREKNDNDSIVSWFATEYFATSPRSASSKSYEASSGVRNQIQKLISNAYLNKVLNPPTAAEIKERGETFNYLDFDEILRNGDVCTICSAQGPLGALGDFLGFFLILQIQSAVFRRPGTEDTRRGAMFYIDEFQTYANPGMSNMLTQGRSYRVGCILATQGRSQIGMDSGNKGKAFTSLISTNARNIIIFPGVSSDDANYYSKEFGEELIEQENVSVSRDRFSVNFNQKETIRKDEKYEARFRPTDIIYRPFGEAMIRIIKDASVQVPQILKLSFIPKDINDRAVEYINEFNKEQLVTDDLMFDDDAKRKNDTIKLNDYEEFNSIKYADDIFSIEIEEVDTPEVFDDM